MSAWSVFGWVLAALLFFWGVGAYNRLMRLRNRIAEAFGVLDQGLQQRAELSKRLLEQLRPLLANEQASFDALESAQAETLQLAQAARARPHAGDPVASLAVASAVQAAALTRVMSIVEHHGELREQAEGLQALMDELRLAERQRSFSRQLFNQAVAQYNEALAQFPTRILASIYGFAEARSL